MHYPKHPLTFSDQLGLIQQRGLLVDDPARALRWLEQVSYYRLSAYFLPFKHGNQFLPGAEFNEIAGLYIFDRKLRLLVLDAIERVEVAVRTAITYQISHAHGPFGHVDSANFAPRYDHRRLMHDINTEESRAGETFVSHFRAKYTDEAHLPVWMASELLSFGTVSLMYKHLAPALKKPIATPYGVPDWMFAGWIHALSYVRNVCAHHKRFWNRELGIRPSLPTRSGGPALAWAVGVPDTGRVYCILAILRHMLLVVSPQCHWKDRLFELLDSHPTVPQASMGFPANWKQQPLWQ